MRLSPNYHGLLAFIGSARATNSHRAQMLKALSITPFERGIVEAHGLISWSI